MCAVGKVNISYESNAEREDNWQQYFVLLNQGTEFYHINKMNVCLILGASFECDSPPEYVNLCTSEWSLILVKKRFCKVLDLGSVN